MSPEHIPGSGTATQGREVGAWCVFQKHPMILMTALPRSQTPVP